MRWGTKRKHTVLTLSHSLSSHVHIFSKKFKISGYEGGEIHHFLCPDWNGKGITVTIKRERELSNEFRERSHVFAKSTNPHSMNICPFKKFIYIWSGEVYLYPCRLQTFPTITLHLSKVE